MNKSQRKNMERLIKLLENWKKEQPKLHAPDGTLITEFDMGDWQCGTAACALGSAACHPFFKKRGLAIDEDGDIVFGVGDKLTSGFSVGVELLGITYRESNDLFSPDYYDYDVKPKEVAKRLRQLLEEYDDERN